MKIETNVRIRTHSDIIKDLKSLIEQKVISFENKMSVINFTDSISTNYDIKSNEDAIKTLSILIKRDNIFFDNKICAILFADKFNLGNMCIQHLQIQDAKKQSIDYYNIAKSYLSEESLKALKRDKVFIEDENFYDIE